MSPDLLEPIGRSDTATQICIGAIQVAVVLAALFVVWLFRSYVESLRDARDPHSPTGSMTPRVRLIRREEKNTGGGR